MRKGHVGPWRSFLGGKEAALGMEGSLTVERGTGRRWWTVRELPLTCAVAPPSTGPAGHQPTGTVTSQAFQNTFLAPGLGPCKDERVLRQLSCPGRPGWAECFLSTGSVNFSTEQGLEPIPCQFPTVLRIQSTGPWVCPCCPLRPGVRQACSSLGLCTCSAGVWSASSSAIPAASFSLLWLSVISWERCAVKTLSKVAVTLQTHHVDPHHLELSLSVILVSLMGVRWNFSYFPGIAGWAQG